MDFGSTRTFAFAILVAFALLVTLVIGATAWVVVHHRRVWNVAAALLRPITENRRTQALRERYPRTWSFVGARLDPGEYLGLHLTVGLALSVAALAAFVAVADNVFEPSDLQAVDGFAPRVLHTAVGLQAVPIFNVLTSLGDILVLTIVTGITAVVLFVRRRRASALALMIGATGVWALVAILKLLFQRERPVPLPGADLPVSWSFPSGHAMASLVVYGLVAYAVALSLRNSSARIAVFLAAGMLVVLIGITRVYLGVHHFTDVIAGYAGGTIWLASIVSASEVVRRRNSRLATY